MSASQLRSIMTRPVEQFVLISEFLIFSQYLFKQYYLYFNYYLICNVIALLVIHCKVSKNIS